MSFLRGVTRRAVVSGWPMQTKYTTRRRLFSTTTESPASPSSPPPPPAPPSLEEQMQTRYKSDTIQLLKKRPMLTDDDFAHERRLTLGGAELATAEILEDDDDERIMNGDYESIEEFDADVDIDVAKAAAAQREKLLADAASGDYYVPEVFDEEAPPFRKFRKMLQYGKIDSMLDRAMEQLQSAGEGHVARFVKDPSGNFQVSVVSRASLSPQERATIVEMDYERNPELAKARAAELEAAQAEATEATEATETTEANDDGVDQQEEEDEVVDDEIVFSPQHEEDVDTDAEIADKPYEYAEPFNAIHEEAELHDSLRHKLVQLGTTSTALPIII